MHSLSQGKLRLSEARIGVLEALPIEVLLCFTGKFGGSGAWLVVLLKAQSIPSAFCPVLAVPKSLAKTVGNLSRYLKQISAIRFLLNGLEKTTA